MTISSISKSYYEILEVHTLPRGLYGLTLRINKKDATQYIENRGTARIPIGSLTFVVSETDNVPEYASFIFVSKYLGFNMFRYATTKNLNKIHKRLAEVKDALKNPRLHVTINGKIYPRYSVGIKYDNGIYLGTVVEDSKLFHTFNNNNIIIKEIAE